MSLRRPNRATSRRCGSSTDGGAAERRSDHETEGCTRSRTLCRLPRRSVSGGGAVFGIGRRVCAGTSGRSIGRSFRTSLPVGVPEPLPTADDGAGLYRGEGPCNDPAACRGFCPTAARPGLPAQRRAPDPDAGASGLRGAARHGLLLPGMPRQMAWHSGGAPADGSRTGVCRGGADGVDRTADGPVVAAAVPDYPLFGLPGCNNL